MAKKIFVLVLSYFAFCIITFTSCDLTYEATICDIHFAGLHAIRKSQNDEPHTFDDQIGFEFMSIHSSLTCYSSPPQIFNSAYATTKCAKYRNQLIQSSFQISFDRPFIYALDTISSNTDLLAIAEIYSATEITLIHDCKFMSGTIIFKPELVDQLQFELGVYDVTFKCSTNDGQEYVKTIKVIFDE